MSLLNSLGKLHAVAYIAVMLLHASEARRSTGSALLLTEMVLLAAVFRFLSPLVGFVVYFNLFHSARHLMRLAKEAKVAPHRLSGLWRHRKQVVAVLVTIATVAGIGAAQLNLTLNGNMDAAGEALRVVFIGLSCLTTPHMVLIYTALDDHYTDLKYRRI
jgi:Brp/Blh family beta-carotene 15,15'-monooxygenase